MNLVLDLNSGEEQELIAHARREGVTVTEYARRCLPPPSPTDRNGVEKPFNIMQFAAAPRPPEYIQSQIDEILHSIDRGEEVEGT